MTAVDDDLLVPLGESLLGLFERVPRLPPLLRQVYLLFRGKEVVQLFEREGVRVDRERPDRAAVLRLAADDAEPLVDALMLRVPCRSGGTSCPSAGSWCSGIGRRVPRGRSTDERCGRSG